MIERGKGKRMQGDYSKGRLGGRSELRSDSTMNAAQAKWNEKCDCKEKYACNHESESAVASQAQK